MCRGWGDAEASLLCSSCLSRQLFCPAALAAAAEAVPAAVGHKGLSLSRFLVPSILSFRLICHTRKQHRTKNAPKIVPVAWDTSLQLKHRGQRFPESSTGLAQAAAPRHESSLVFSHCCLEACHKPSSLEPVWSVLPGSGSGCCGDMQPWEGGRAGQGSSLAMLMLVYVLVYVLFAC